MKMKRTRKEVRHEEIRIRCEKVAGAREAVDRRTRAWCAAVRSRLADTRGQGTTEYAILVGVLVVIAIIAITLFRPKLQELWDAIASGINSL